MVTTCSQGICVPTTWAPDKYLKVDAVDQYIEQVRPTWQSHAGMDVLMWNFELLPCRCLDNQKLVEGGCVAGVINSYPQCETCPPGKMCHGGNAVVDPCPKDYYCFDGVKTLCDPLKAQACESEGLSMYVGGCIAGHYYASQSSCPACPAGSYLEAIGVHKVTACTLCTAGTSHNLDTTTASSCVSCLAGTFTSGAGKTMCTACVDGTYQIHDQGTLCSDCLPGHAWQSSKQVCRPCMAGTYASGRQSKTCTQCEPGTYASVEGSSVCTACPDNKSTRTFGKSENVYMLDDNGGVGKTSASDCAFCEAGFVACSIIDACGHDCMACPVGTYFCPGNNSRIMCTTQKLGGEYYRSAECTATQDAVFSRCTVCGPGEYEAAACSVNNQDRKCHTCTKSVVMITYTARACNATHDTETRDCSDDTIHAGGLCNPCLAGTYAAGGECRACPANWYSEGGGACVPCASGFVSGPGAGRCSRKCIEGEMAVNGIECQSAERTVVEELAWTWRLQGFHSMVWQEDGSILVVTNQGASMGMLWKMDTSGEASAIVVVGLGSVAQVLQGGNQEVVVVEKSGYIRRIDTLTWQMTTEARQWTFLVPAAAVQSPHSDRVFIVAAQHRIWSVGVTLGSTEQLLQGDAEGRRSVGFHDASCLSFPSSLALQVDHTHIVVVLDDFGIWAFDLLQPGQARWPLCGGGTESIGDSSVNSRVYVDAFVDRVGIACSRLQFERMQVRNVVTAYVRGFSSVVFAMANGGVAYFEMGNYVTYLLTATGYQQVFVGHGGKLLAGTASAGIRAVELGLDGCLCKAGLYCMAMQNTSQYACVQAPAGTFAPSRSYAPIPCKVGTVGTGPGAANRSEGCQVCAKYGDVSLYTTYAQGAVNCERACSNANLPFYDRTKQTCVQGCNAGSIMKGGSCQKCPRGSSDSGNIACVACAVSTYYEDAEGICKPCPGNSTTYFEAVDQCATGSQETDHGGPVASGGSQPWQGFSSLACAGGETVWGGSSAEGLWRMNATGRTLALAGAHTYTLIAVNDDESVVYGAAAGGHCISAGQGAVYVGRCEQSGEEDGPRAYARFASIQSLAYMHVEGQTAMLFVASMVSGCASIRGVSLFDGSVSTLASYSEVRGNRIVLGQCLGTLTLATARGSNKLYYFSSDAGQLWMLANDGQGQPVGVFLVPSAVLQAVCVFSAAASEQQKLVTVLLSSQPTDMTVLRIHEEDGTTEAIWNVSVRSSVGALACMGKRVWIAQPAGIQIVSVPEGGCLGGYVKMGGVCAKLGVGQFSQANGQVAACKSGTYGTKAGAWSHAFCKECPSGSVSAEGALACEPCPAHLPLAKGSLCVAVCPAGTYQQDATCVLCPAGMDSRAGAARSSLDCKPCAAGFYANASTAGVCQPCPTNFSSPAQSHHCVIVCATGQCSAKDGEPCMSLTENWEMLTSIDMRGSGMRAVTVSRNGYVFYSDGNAISYFQDDCVMDKHVQSVLCRKTGTVLLQRAPLNRGISSLVVTHDYVNKECTQRYLYAASVSTHGIYRLTVTFNGGGVTGQDWILWIGGVPGFVDGALAVARFNMPSELELLANGTKLFVSDYLNHRIRVVNLQTQMVSTLLGYGLPCWRYGSLTAPTPYATGEGSLPDYYCDAYSATSRAATRRPMGMGLSLDNSRLFVAMNEEDSVGELNFGAQTFSRTCALDLSLIDNRVETCRTDVSNSRSCFLWKPYDVAMTERSLFVSVTNGVTKIDLDSLTCQQVAGTLWNLEPDQSRGYVDGEWINDTYVSSKVYNPFKMVFARDTGIMYVADLSNGAVRRIFIDGRCQCAEGSVYVESARACYEPTQRWATQMLVQCEEDGYFALEGDTQCRSCLEALSVGLTNVIACQIWAKKRLQASSRVGFSFSQVVANPTPSGASATADWFGVENLPDIRKYDDIVNEGVMRYALRESPVSRPKTWRYEEGNWVLELDPQLQPKVVVPGLWYPCNIINQLDGSVQCSQVERVLGGVWANARFMAQRLGAQAMWQKRQAQALWEKKQGQAIWGWSRFMLPVTTADLIHIQEEVPAKLESAPPAPLRPANSKVNYVGWPAHFYCAGGFVVEWLPSAACVSCMAGTYSMSVSPGHGPYECNACFLGKYSSGVAASLCTRCASGFYSNRTGSQQCTACRYRNYFTVGGAMAESQCSPCDPGTGNCSSCVPGQYQEQAAQDACKYCAAGSVSSEVNATKCTRCPVGYFQERAGMMFCEPCPRGTYAPNEGASACSVCNDAKCVLAVGGVCGVGCDANQYWNETNHTCAVCPVGTLNTDVMCALDATACWTPTAGKFYSVNTRSIADCPPGTQANANFDDCEYCVAGTHHKAGYGCVPCAGGWYSTGSGLTACLGCPAGAYTPALAYALTAVIRVLERSTTNAGHTGCLACAAGNYSFSNVSSACVACRGGSYSNHTGASMCTRCPNGTYSVRVGSTSVCQGQCQAALGWYSGEGASACTFCTGGVSSGGQCTPCGLGHYLDGGRCQLCPLGLVNMWTEFGANSSVCQPCWPPSTFAEANRHECTDAGPGYASTGTGRVECGPGSYRGANDTLTAACLLCAPGSHASRARSEQCLPCELGKYGGQHGLSACVACYVGTVADVVGRSECRQCQAGTRAAYAGRVCEPCPNNTFSVDGTGCLMCMDEANPYAPAGASVCGRCPDGTSMSGRGLCEGCAAGQYMWRSELGYYYCQPCPQGRMTPHAGATSVSQCVLCEGGLVPNKAQDACVACPTGQQKAANREGVCEACAVGTYSSNGSMARCAHCSAGAYSSSMGASACVACALGAYGNVVGATAACDVCAAGTYANTTGQTACAPCGPTMFASSTASVACQVRRTRCAVGQFLVLHTAQPTLDNECADCHECKDNEFTLLAAAAMSWLAGTTYSMQVAHLCPGNTTSALFKCVSTKSEKGFYLSLIPGAGASSDSSSDLQVAQIACTDIADVENGRMMYVAGLRPTQCYVGCKYGVLNFESYFRSNGAATEDNPLQNIFLPLALAHENQLCRACPTSQCGLNTYRPQVTTLCGPTCASVAGCGDGCTGTCQPAPVGAQIVDGSSTLGSDACPWQCLPGWHISDDGTYCRNCTSEDPDTFCMQGFVLVDTTRECRFYSNSSDLCQKCNEVPGGRAKGWNSLTRQCTYECLGGYFAADATNQTCVLCSVYNAIECAVGLYRDYVGCLQQGTPPLCRPCGFPAMEEGVISFTSNGGLSARNCSGLCNVGFHSYSMSKLWYVEEPINVFDLWCQRCVPTLDSITCHGACQPGQFRNKSVANGLQVGACVRCLTSAECGIAKYAPVCSGNGSANVGCLDCAWALLHDGNETVPTREFVPYTVRGDPYKWSLISPVLGDCPSACKVNYVRNQYGKCVSCQNLVVPQVLSLVPGQPTYSDFVYAHWNATPGPVWWQEAFSPPLLQLYARPTGKIVQRAGLCWACPYGQGTLQGDDDVCVVLPGFGRSVDAYQMTRMQIPVLGPDVYMVMQEPTLPTLMVPEQRRRVLLAAAGASSMQTTAVTTVVRPCAFGYYKAERGNAVCNSCPYGTSTMQQGAISIRECVCLPGWYRRNTSYACTECPAETYLPYGTNALACLPCPPNETTFGQVANTACACGWGRMRVGPQKCALCPANTYCRPCMSNEKCAASSNRVISSACFLDSSSPPGSTTIANCTCKSGLVVLQRRNSKLFYCAPVPPHAVYDASLQRIACLPGWRERWDDTNAQLLECYLCEKGFYASPPIFPTLQCAACPVGSYADTRDAIHNCTDCPFSLSTKQVGAVSVVECGCPWPMVGSGTTCLGCRSDQYLENGRCQTCPANAMSKAGSTQCECKPGYFYVLRTQTCEKCGLGTFSAHAGSSTTCSLCPAGSTTASVGSVSIKECAICQRSYVWMEKMGCVSAGLLLP